MFIAPKNQCRQLTGYNSKNRLEDSPPWMSQKKQFALLSNADNIKSELLCWNYPVKKRSGPNPYLTPTPLNLAKNKLRVLCKLLIFLS
jgi:hypothetical protein